MNWSNQWFAAPSGEKKHETKDLWVCSIPLDPLVVDVKSIKMVCLSQSVSTFLGADLPSFSRRSPIAMQFFKPCSGCPITMTFFRDSTFSKHTEKEKDDYIHSWKAKVHVWRGQFLKNEHWKENVSLSLSLLRDESFRIWNFITLLKYTHVKNIFRQGGGRLYNSEV